jgi:hypothetical protein
MCPYCREEIIAAAVKCRFCQTMLDGSVNTADAPSDCYAMGVVLFKMLSGVVPFPQESEGGFEVTRIRVVGVHLHANAESGLDPASRPISTTEIQLDVNGESLTLIGGFVDTLWRRSQKQMAMKNFTSPSLGRTFESILFVDSIQVAVPGT